jgi:N-acetylglucosamine-6-phosphate deacetylase
MAEAFRRVVTDCGFAVADAVLAASTTPARLLRHDDVGVIAAGRRADLVHLDDDLRPRQVWYGGQVVPSA